MTLVGTDYTLAVEVAGMGDRQSTNTIKVPMSSLSRTMQFIHRQGGKVLNVTRIGNAAEVTAPAPVAVTAPAAASSPKAVDNEPAKDNRNDKNDKRGGKSKKR